MKARNYGAAHSGGDSHAMGEALNEEIHQAWVAYRLAGGFRKPAARDYSSIWFCRYALRLLLSIRRAARGDALRTSMGVERR